MKTFTQQQVIDAYDRLPDPVKDAIFEETTVDKIQAIGKKHGLLLDKMGNLAEEVGYVMLGLISAKEFPEYIMNTCGIPAEKAGEIITDLNRDVFLPIQEHIFAVAKSPVQSIKKEELSAQAPPPPFRQSSFAMPMQGAPTPSSTKGQPSVAPMIFPQKMRAEDTKPILGALQNQPSIAPRAPEFRETIIKSKVAPVAGDPYREPIQ